MYKLHFCGCDLETNVKYEYDWETKIANLTFVIWGSLESSLNAKYRW